MQADLSQLKLVYHALHERKRLLDNASHLAAPLAILTARFALCSAVFCAAPCSAWQCALLMCMCCPSPDCHLHFAALLPMVGGALLLGRHEGGARQHNIRSGTQVKLNSPQCGDTASLSE